jgi:hypothetical protein
MEPFYLTVTSSGAGHFAEENGPSKFRVHLGKAHKLQGDWEVGLAEIHVPSMLYTESKTKITSNSTGPPKMETVYLDLDDPKLSLLNIECDLIADQYVDHMHHKVLRTINIKKNKYIAGNMRSYTFDNIFYFALATADISNVGMFITTDAGKKALFTSGTVTALLHFRPRQNGRS